MADSHQMDDARNITDHFNAGAPAEAADAEKLQSFWRAMKELSEHQPQSKATGLGAFAGAGFNADDVSPIQMISLMLRARLIDHLLERGVLKEFEHAGVPNDAVFRAAATMPLTKDDVGEAMVLLQFQKMPPEEAAKVKAEWLNAGYDPEHPKIDLKFVSAVRQAETKS